MVEMILFCKLNFALIPTIIPVIAPADIDAHLPIRLRDPNLQNDVQPIIVAPIELDSDLEEENNFGDDD